MLKRVPISKHREAESNIAGKDCSLGDGDESTASQRERG